VHGIDHEAVTHPWGGALELDVIAARLGAGAFTHLAMVHHETTTGRLNPLQELLDLCRRHDVAVLLDGVSSFGAEAIPFDHPALEAVAATANKCLHGIPGLAFVLCRAGVLEQDMPRRSLYLHLPDWAAKQQADSTPYTPPVNSVLALEQALRELVEEGGWRGRRESYRQRAGRVRQDLEALGVTPWLAPQDSSCVLRSYRLPEGFDYATVHDSLKQAGFVIYEGQGNLATEMFRVSTMGDISAADLERLGAAFSKLFSPPATAARRS
jgi:2-aminoethylphosphonate-pyruvate transaminase